MTMTVEADTTMFIFYRDAVLEHPAGPNWNNGAHLSHAQFPVPWPEVISQAVLFITCLRAKVTFLRNGSDGTWRSVKCGVSNFQGTWLALAAATSLQPSLFPNSETV